MATLLPLSPSAQVVSVPPPVVRLAVVRQADVPEDTHKIAALSQTRWIGARQGGETEGAAGGRRGAWGLTPPPSSGFARRHLPRFAALLGGGALTNLGRYPIAASERRWTTVIEAIGTPSRLTLACFRAVRGPICVKRVLKVGRIGDFAMRRLKVRA